MILRKEIINIKGTAHLKIGDPMYFETLERNPRDNAKNYVFNGNISAAPFGKIKIQESLEEYGDISLRTIDVLIGQVSKSKMDVLDAYMRGRYYPSLVKKEYELGCDSAEFGIKTKYGSDLFRTGGDGCYGHIIHNKQYYGMILDLTFDGDLFSYDEIKTRMLALFPERERQRDVTTEISDTHEETLEEFDR